MVLAETMHARMMAAQPAYNSIPVNDFNVYVVQTLCRMHTHDAVLPVVSTGSSSR
jgi:hypothetical protein